MPSVRTRKCWDSAGNLPIEARSCGSRRRTGLELGHLALILVGRFHDPSLQGFLAGGAGLGLKNPIAKVGGI